MMNAGSSIKFIRQHVPEFIPEVGIILGSGLGSLVQAIEACQTLNYQDIPNFPKPNVAGHSGQLHLGRLGSTKVACLQGRSHFYEGSSNETILNLISTLYHLGCKTLIVTNAAGSLRPNMPPGELMLIKDHINFQFRNVLVGCFEEGSASPFIDLEEAYCSHLRKNLIATAVAQNITLYEGVYVGVLGPSFETPAEIRAFAQLGADAVGMSTIPEVIAARYYGMRVAGISVITNMAAGLSSEKLSHEHTLQNAQLSSQKLMKLLLAFFENLTCPEILNPLN